MVVNLRSLAIAAALLSGFAATQNQALATCSGTPIQYKASGQFGANVISGDDKLKLAGEPYVIYVLGCTTATPTKTGSDYDEYYPVTLSGEVKSSLLVTPYTIKATAVAMILQIPPTGNDSVQLIGTVEIEGSPISIHADIALPAGTLPSLSIAAFPTASIVPSKSEFIYSEGTDSTALSVVGNGSASVYTPPPTNTKANVMLHEGAAQVITLHADGTQSITPMKGAVDPAASFEKTMLQFYASGVRDAADVHVQIGGQEVKVLYAGAAGHFDGLDEVTVELPRSLAGLGDVEVALTADGQAATPVHIHIQ